MAVLISAILKYTFQIYINNSIEKMDKENDTSFENIQNHLF